MRSYYYYCNVLRYFPWNPITLVSKSCHGRPAGSVICKTIWLANLEPEIILSYKGPYKGWRQLWAKLDQLVFFEFDCWSTSKIMLCRVADNHKQRQECQDKRVDCIDLFDCVLIVHPSHTYWSVGLVMQWWVTSTYLKCKKSNTIPTLTR
jgi:hypothetical protein